MHNRSREIREANGMNDLAIEKREMNRAFFLPLPPIAVGGAIFLVHKKGLDCCRKVSVSASFSHAYPIPPKLESPRKKVTPGKKRKNKSSAKSGRRGKERKVEITR